MKKVGVIRGGVSPEYLFSIQTGAEVIRAIQESGYEAIDLFLDQEGVLHVWGVPITPAELPQKVDVVWNALHGEFGEDGKLQQLLNQLHIPYVGADTAASALFAKKDLAKEVVSQDKIIKTPTSMLLFPEDDMSVSELTRAIYTKMAPPWVIKPLSGGASINTFFIKTPLELSQYVDQAIQLTQPFLVEQYIYGREAVVSVARDFRDEDVYSFPVVEIKSPINGIYTSENRNGEDSAVVYGSFTKEERAKLEELAKGIHKKHDLGDFSQIEFILDAKGDAWFLEADTVPHLHPQSPFRKALHAVGATLKELVQTFIPKKK